MRGRRTTPPRRRRSDGGIPADADAYWLARDLLRTVAEGGEVTELPEGAIYQSLDGTDERWIYRGREAGWQRLSPADHGTQA